MVVQALVVTHELVKYEHADQYLTQTLAPLIPLMVEGRSAHAAPTRRPDECLWYAWRVRRTVFMHMLMFA